MLAWLKAMAREWPLSVYAVLSFTSTIATYSRPFVPGHLRFLLSLSAVIAFVAAVMRVDMKRQKQIAELEQELSELQTDSKPKADLVIHPGRRSRYIMLRANDQHPLPPRGLHIELDLSIENKGRRISSIKEYTLTLPDFAKSYAKVEPYFTVLVPGRNSGYALTKEQFFPPGEFIRVPAESVEGPKLLAFQILDLPLNSFGTRAFDGNRETRIFPTIRCVLMIVDTEGYSAAYEFKLEETK
jgi:hypothetical protein